MKDRLRGVAVGAAALVLMLVAAGCTGDGDGDGGGVSDAAAAAGSTSFDVSLTDFAIVPDLIEAAPGETLAFNVSNDGNAPHTFGRPSPACSSTRWRSTAPSRAPRSA